MPSMSPGEVMEFYFHQLNLHMKFEVMNHKDHSLKRLIICTKEKNYKKPVFQAYIQICIFAMNGHDWLGAG